MTFINQTPYAYCLEADLPIRLTMCGTRFPSKDFSHVRRVLPDFGTFLVIKGTFTVIDEFPKESIEYCIEEGVAHTIGPGIYQQNPKVMRKGERFLWYHFLQNAPYKILTEQESKNLIQSQFLQNKPQKFILVPIHFDSKTLVHKLVEIHDQLNQQVKKWGSADIGSQILCNHLIYAQHQELVNRFTENLVNKNIKRMHVRKAQEVIRDFYATTDTLSQIAKILELNPSYLSRCFKECTGLTVQHYIQQCKIEAAIQLMRLGNKNIKTIAFETGFSDINYFCRVFKKITGKTTKVFRLN